MSAADRAPAERHRHALDDLRARLALLGVPCWPTDPAFGAAVFFVRVNGVLTLLPSLADLAAVAAALEHERRHAAPLSMQRSRGVKR